MRWSRDQWIAEPWFATLFSSRSSTRSGHAALYDRCDHSRCAPAVMPSPPNAYMKNPNAYVAARVVSAPSATCTAQYTPSACRAPRYTSIGHRTRFTSGTRSSASARSHKVQLNLYLYVPRARTLVA